MKKIFVKNTEHCCELMQHYLDEKKVAIYFNPIFREYFIKLRSFLNGKHTIYNCPWCGCEFPDSLVKKYYEVLEGEYNILYEPLTNKYYEVLDDSKEYEEIGRDLPEEFKSDEWWKKRSF